MSQQIVNVGVVGGGRMGSGVAHAYLTAGASVVLVEADAQRVESARATVGALVSSSVERGSVEESADAILSRLTVTAVRSDLASSELVIEAVPEDPAMKIEVLSEVESFLAPTAVLATNTSSISIDALAQSLQAPHRFVGMHFFNPVPASKLVEVIRGAKTDEQTIALVLQAVERIKKTPIVVGDSPGFATSRLGLALGLEAVRMVEEGVASAEDIDSGMVLGYKHPVGPLRLTDMVGLDVRLGIARYLHQELGDRFAPPQLLIDKVERGELGMKSGRGFFEWPS
jgi:3-hydroxybutyryl-CoA dehydrogenase